MSETFAEIHAVNRDAAEQMLVFTGMPDSVVLVLDPADEVSEFGRHLPFESAPKSRPSAVGLGMQTDDLTDQAWTIALLDRWES